MDQFECSIDGTVTLEAIDNGDNEHLIINLMHANGTVLGIGLTPEQAHELADTLHTLAAGLDY